MDNDSMSALSPETIEKLIWLREVIAAGEAEELGLEASEDGVYWISTDEGIDCD